MTVRDCLIKSTASAALKIINANLQNPASGVNVCIRNGFGCTADQRKELCAAYCGNCSACIEDLLDEEVKL